MIRERSTGSYRVGPYFLAKSTSDIGLYTVAPILYATAVYWCVGLTADAGVFFKFLLLFMGQVRQRREGGWTEGAEDREGGGVVGGKYHMWLVCHISAGTKMVGRAAPVCCRLAGFGRGRGVSDSIISGRQGGKRGPDIGQRD